MTKQEFQKKIKAIISQMLDRPIEVGVYQKTKCFREFDLLFDEITQQEPMEINNRAFELELEKRIKTDYLLLTGLIEEIEAKLRKEK